MGHCRRISRTSRGGVGVGRAVLGAAALLGAIAAGGLAALAEAPGGTADPPAAKAPAAPSAPESAVSEKPAQPAGDKKPPAARKMTEEEILELPILHRYELPTEKLETLLGDVKDHTFNYDEPAFYALVAFISKRNPEALRPTAEDEDMDYSQLLSTPSSYRGQPVTIRGAYMTVTPWRVPVVALAKDVPRLFTCTLRELPLEKTLPVATVIVMEDPMACLSVGDEVRVKGYFYKIRDYQGTKGPGQAPMILARRLEPVEGVAAGAGLLRAERSPLYIGAFLSDPKLILMVAGILLMIVVFFYLMMRNRSKKTHATGKYPFYVHRFRLRRDGRPGPFDPVGPAHTAGGSKPQGGPDQ